MKNNSILTTHEHEIELEEDVIAVDFTCELHGENDGIGSYEFWGAKYYDEGSDYLVLDHLKWDESIFTKEQNEAIQAYINDDNNWSHIEEIVSQRLYDENEYDDDYYGDED
jgi:hypothetical protein